MGKGLIRLSHPVGVFLFLDGSPRVIECIQEFPGKSLAHRLFIPRPGISDDPSKGKRCSPLGPYLYRHLVCRAADPPRFHLQHRLDVVDSCLKDLERVIACLFLDNLECPLADSFSYRFLTVFQHDVDKLTH